MDDIRVGAVIRAVRIRRKLRQTDLAAAVGVSDTLISRLERGQLGGVPIDTVRKVLAALVPEVSFSIYGERGVIDMLLWHPARRALLVVELKTGVARPSHQQQLDIYVEAARALFPGVPVTGKLIYA